MSKRLTKNTSLLTIFVFLLQLWCPVLLHSSEPEPTDPKSGGVANYFQKIPSRIFRNLNSSAENMTPEQMEEVIARSQTKTFVGDPTLREENSSILRPVKQVALKVLDGEVGIIKSFLSFQGAKFLKNSLSNPESKLAMGKARQVVNLLSPKQLTRLDRAINRLNIPGSLKRHVGHMSPRLKSFMKSEGNFALMSVIGALISMGIYDGLDLNTMKDKVLALDPLTMNNTVSHALIPRFFSEMSKRHFYSFFNNRFDSFYNKMINSTSFGARILKRLELKADVIGAKLSKAHRMGITKSTGESLAKKLGLVGVGEGTKFALKDFLRSVSTGLAFGLVANVVADSVLVGVKGYEDATVIGGNRNKHSFRPEYNAFLFQRSENKIQNWMNERKFALMDVWDTYRKTPLTKVVSAVTGFTGAYLGSVVAGAILVGGGLPAMVGGVMIASVFGGIGDFVGRWATTKFERSDSMKEFRRGLVEKRLVKVIAKMEISTRNQMSEEEIRTLAAQRSQDMYKREAKGQVYNRMFLVEDFSHVLLYDSGGYVHMKVEEAYGEAFDMQAHIRYDLVSIDGNQGIWDIKTNEIYDVGNIQSNNGLRVILITDDENIELEDDVLHSREETNFRVLTNGLLMTKSDFDSQKWVIKGQNVNTDLFLRSRKDRYTWDKEASIYRKVLDESLELGFDPLEPLLDSFDYLEDDGGVQRVQEKIQGMILQTKDQALENIENLPLGEEASYFQSLEENGASTDAVQQLIMMGTDGWKTLLSGKIHRGTPRQISEFMGSIDGQDFDQLKHSLKEELENPSMRTLWDDLRDLINPASLSAQFAR